MARDHAYYEDNTFEEGKLFPFYLFLGFRLFGMVLALTGTVCADQGVTATLQTHTIGTTTTADVVGLAMEHDAGTWTLTNDPPGPFTISTISQRDYSQLIPG